MRAWAGFVGTHSPEHVEWSEQVRSLCFKKTAPPLMPHLEKAEIQALLSAFIGFCLAAGIGWTVVRATADTALPVIMTPAMILMLLLLTVFMSVLSAVLAITKVMRIDPARVFKA